jgi:structural maintenance of chromosome 3 (chondroitin sulfate proteoglycan 6)
MDTASSIAKKYNLDTITLQGDQVSKRGALTGGYIDVKRSRLKAFEELKAAKESFHKLSDDLKKTKDRSISMRRTIHSVSQSKS